MVTLDLIDSTSNVRLPTPARSVLCPRMFRLFEGDKHTSCSALLAL